MEDSEKQDPTPPASAYLSDSPSNSRRIYLPLFGILVLVVTTLLVIKASVNRNTALNRPEKVEISEGAELPDLELTRIDGSKTPLSRLPHRIMMINFWATWCESCIEEMPSLVKLRDQYAPKGFEVLGINVDENPKKATPPMIEKFKMKFPQFTDPGNVLADLFDVHAIPLSVVVNQDRKILLVENGGRDWDSEDVHQLMETWLKK
jgi:thiol-disulfide isomerase/thioredoxin